MKAISRSRSPRPNSTRAVAGTVFSDGRPRLIQVKDINLDAEFAPHMLYVANEDKPGFIGKLGTVLGEAKVNIANFTLGRSAPGPTPSRWSRWTGRSSSRSSPTSANCRWYAKPRRLRSSRPAA